MNRRALRTEGLKLARGRGKKNLQEIIMYHVSSFFTNGGGGRDRIYRYTVWRSLLRDKYTVAHGPITSTRPKRGTRRADVRPQHARGAKSRTLHPVITRSVESISGVNAPRCENRTIVDVIAHVTWPNSEKINPIRLAGPL